MYSYPPKAKPDVRLSTRAGRRQLCRGQVLGRSIGVCWPHRCTSRLSGSHLKEGKKSVSQVKMATNTCKTRHQPSADQPMDNKHTLHILYSESEHAATLDYCEPWRGRPVPFCAPT